MGCITFLVFSRLTNKTKTWTVYTDKELLAGLRQNKSKIIEYLYKESFFPVRQLVINNGGSDEDAEDIVNDGLTVLFNKCRNGELKLFCTLTTFLYAICKHLWLQKLDKKRRYLSHVSSLAADMRQPYYTRGETGEEIKWERERILWKYLKKLPEDCRRILLLFGKGVPFKTITEIFNYKNEDYAKVRKYECQKRLKEWILSDPDFPKYCTYD